MPSLETMTPFPDYPTPADEEERLRSLERTLLLDSESDADLDRITTLASETLDTPIALISLVDRERQWFLSKVGLQASQTPRSMAFCAHAITQGSTLVVPDALDDPRFNTNPLVVSEPNIRFYAGAQLRPQDGQPLGTLCVIDRTPRQFSPRQLRWLQLFSEQVSREIELRQRLARCPITGFFNRSSFEMLCQKEFERARRTHGTLTLLLLRVENLDQVRGLAEATAPDGLVGELAERFSALAAESDLLGRYADACFAMLLVGASTEREQAVSDTLRGASVRSLHPQLLIGLSRLDAEDLSAVDLLIRADNALFLARAVEPIKPSPGP
ncbi:GAF domain-containing protein [Synechococcus sp. RedBA-s]|uniref:sensor domain-containing diguanylate cyclase n=1 Tax=Synechococcus sp. RedBA-s TaxID=2823741 RepID=UPI0020CBC0DF|nr:GAF domain-containing protein [Synechococcus sp. RedBA-s]MCP9799555.1 GAF domain-containing protein [Synechococcus sp. RedBA-s]